MVEGGRDGAPIQSCLKSGAARESIPMWRKVHFVLPDSEQVVQDSSGDEAQADIDLRPGYSMEEDLLAKVDPRTICSIKDIARFGTYEPDPKDLRTTLKKVYYSAARRQMLARVRKRRIPPPLDPDGYATDECYPARTSRSFRCTPCTRCRRGSSLSGPQN